MSGGQIWQMLQNAQIWGGAGRARAQGWAWARPAPMCGHRGCSRPLPIPQAGARALVGPPFRARRPPCLFGLIFWEVASRHWGFGPAVAPDSLAGGARAQAGAPRPRGPPALAWLRPCAAPAETPKWPKAQENKINKYNAK